jgi:hypothetical protein
MTDPASPDPEHLHGKAVESELVDTHDDLRNDLSVEERLSKLEKLDDDEKDRLHKEVLNAELSSADDAPLDTTCSLCGMEATVMTPEGPLCAEHASLSGGRS